MTASGLGMVLQLVGGGFELGALWLGTRRGRAAWRKYRGEDLDLTDDAFLNAISSSSTLIGEKGSVEAAVTEARLRHITVVAERINHVWHFLQESSLLTPVWMFVVGVVLTMAGAIVGAFG